jgi:hypothetical protein
MNVLFEIYGFSYPMIEDVRENCSIHKHHASHERAGVADGVGHNDAVHGWDRVLSAVPFGFVQRVQASFYSMAPSQTSSIAIGNIINLSDAEDGRTGFARSTANHRNTQ